jgi:hypothetical protein
MDIYYLFNQIKHGIIFSYIHHVMFVLIDN